MISGCDFKLVSAKACRPNTVGRSRKLSPVLDLIVTKYGIAVACWVQPVVVVPQPSSIFSKFLRLPAFAQHKVGPLEVERSVEWVGDFVVLDKAEIDIRGFVRWVIEPDIAEWRGFYRRWRNQPSSIGDTRRAEPSRA